MSKAFTSESDDEEEGVLPPALPPGVRNYITPDGEHRMREEKDRLLRERQQVIGSGFELERRRKALDRRLDFLKDRLETLVIVEPAEPSPGQVSFGTRVSVQYDSGENQTWRIVGLDEIDLTQKAISWMSPLATALLEKQKGDTVIFQGKTLTITGISR